MRKNTVLALMIFFIPALILIAKSWINIQPSDEGFGYDALVLLTLLAFINILHISFGYDFLEKFIGKKKFKSKWVILNIIIISVAVVLMYTIFLFSVLDSLPIFTTKYIYTVLPMAVAWVVYSIPSIAVWLFFRKKT